MFSKRAHQVELALKAKVVDFRHRQDRDPTRWERAAQALRRRVLDALRHQNIEIEAELIKLTPSIR